MKDSGMEDGAFGGVFDGHGRNVQIVGTYCWKHLHGSDGDSFFTNDLHTIYVGSKLSADQTNHFLEPPFR